MVSFFAQILSRFIRYSAHHCTCELEETNENEFVIASSHWQPLIVVVCDISKWKDIMSVMSYEI
jgi:hypothetical protein